MLLNVSTSKMENGTYTTYKFESRKVNYEVVTKDHEEFSVWSNRFGPANSTRATFNHYFTGEELAARSKTFANLVEGFKHYQSMLTELSH